MSSHEELQRVALVEFAAAGYTATSIQRIGELAGLSKSSVLYHFASKEALLEAAVMPAIERLEELVAELEARGLSPEYRFIFLEQFVDFIFDFRQEVHLFINQGPSLRELTVIERANTIVRTLAQFFSSATAHPHDKMRFGIALGGSAYMLCTSDNLALPLESNDDTKHALITIMSELLAPINND
ncbi:TetR/AcrR family transcriptional regulator [Salinibacterium sp. M195]|uniref:TetR/AcrR family transcriptional regulator n=1 Tax=Salinibacterium sp. M195 TaxID=2583374 RepID=UPI001C627347|nr:TetR/AcrR family transcriptional regulator [Salinibacterium sp. M195]QYH35655.1 TetR/AcrR family transcriptional regulator [Salinibacterium sp. M195]